MEMPAVHTLILTGYIISIFNFSNKETTIAPELNGNVTMLLNTDWELFGGQTVKSLKKSLLKTIPPFTGLLYAYRKTSDSE